MGAAPGIAFAPSKIGQENQLPAQAVGNRFLALAALAIFASAFLFFQVQLIVGKYILPWFGGAPAVWNTCMVVFQVLLLGGYCYSHLLVSRVPSRLQGRVHLALVGLAAVCVGIAGLRWPSPLTAGLAWRPQDPNHPIGNIIVLLLVTVGVPGIALSSTSPLLQAWTGKEKNAGIYRLYALSNAGSLLGLLSYPFLVERLLTVRAQAWSWSAGYAVFLSAIAACTFLQMKVSRRCPLQPAVETCNSESSDRPPASHRFLWLALPACSSLLLLATTNIICQEIAVIPLLWVLPLAVYLVSFIVCFDNERWYQRGLFQLLFGACAVAVFKILTLLPGTHLLAQILTLTLTLFVACMVCHGELARLKPSATYLTHYYLMLSAGGALGSMFVVFAAPRLFKEYWEYQLGICACAVLLFACLKLDRASWVFGRVRQQILPLAFIVTAGGLCAFYTGVFVIAQMGPMTVFRTRNFFGAKSVVDTGELLRFKDGAIWHGVQFKDISQRDEPTLYYHRQTGIGLLLDNYPRGAQANLRVGLVGLGIGTLAAYGHAGDYYRFYELDPAVIALSKGDHPFFTYLKDSPAQIDVVAGDARISMEREVRTGEGQKFDILAVDAFSSDAIPLHLLTREAMALYLQQLRGPRSVIAFHVTNRNLDLRPVLLGLAQQHKLASADVRFDVVDWVLLSPSDEFLKIPAIANHATALNKGRQPVAWEDNYSNLYQVLKFRSLDLADTFGVR